MPSLAFTSTTWSLLECPTLECSETVSRRVHLVGRYKGVGSTQANMCLKRSKKEATKGVKLFGFC